MVVVTVAVVLVAVDCSQGPRRATWSSWRSLQPVDLRRHSLLWTEASNRSVGAEVGSILFSPSCPEEHSPIGSAVGAADRLVDGQTVDLANIDLLALTLVGDLHLDAIETGRLSELAGIATRSIGSKEEGGGLARREVAQFQPKPSRTLRTHL